MHMHIHAHMKESSRVFHSAPRNWDFFHLQMLRFPRNSGIKKMSIGTELKCHFYIDTLVYKIWRFLDKYLSWYWHNCEKYGYQNEEYWPQGMSVKFEDSMTNNWHVIDLNVNTKMATVFPVCCPIVYHNWWHADFTPYIWNSPNYEKKNVAKVSQIIVKHVVISNVTVYDLVVAR